MWLLWILLLYCCDFSTCPASLYHFWPAVPLLLFGYWSFSLGLDRTFCRSRGFLIEVGTKRRLDWSHSFSLDLIAAARRHKDAITSLNSDSLSPQNCSDPCPFRSWLVWQLIGFFEMSRILSGHSFSAYIIPAWLWSFSIKGPQSQLEGHKRMNDWMLRRKGTFSPPDRNSLFLVVLFPFAGWLECILLEVFVRTQGLFFCC